MTDYAVEIDAWTGSGVETLRFASRTLVTGPSDTPANTPYLGRIVDPGNIQRGILDGGVLARPSVGFGGIVLNNQDGRLDGLIDNGFDGRAIVVREVSDQSPVSAPVVLRGVLAGLAPSTSWKDVQLRVRDGLAALQVSLLTARYAGTTTSTGLGVEGDASLKDRLKPRVLGSVTSIAPVAVNAFDLLYQASAGAVSSIQVYDGAVPLLPAGDFPTLPALMAATFPAASTNQYFGTCLAAGFFRLDDKPAFAITADVVEGATLSARSAPAVAMRILTALGLAYDPASFAALHTKNSAEVGIYVDAETQALDIVGQLLGSIGAALVPNSDGVLQAVRLEAPSGASMTTFTLRDFSSDDMSLATEPDSGGVPAWSVALNWGRIWQTASAEDVARSGVTADRASYLLTANRQAVASDGAVRTAHPLAATVNIDTLLTQRSDAEAEAARLLALYKARRDRFTLTVPDRRGRLPIGATVTLKMPRFGYAAGKPMLVVSRKDDFGKRTVQLGLWG